MPDVKSCAFKQFHFGGITVFPSPDFKTRALGAMERQLENEKFPPFIVHSIYPPSPPPDKQDTMSKPEV